MADSLAEDALGTKAQIFYDGNKVDVKVNDATLEI